MTSMQVTTKKKYLRNIHGKPRRKSAAHPLHVAFAHTETQTYVAQINELQEGFSLNQIEFAGQLLHCAPRSLLLWKNGAVPNPSTIIRLNELTRLYHALSRLMPKKSIGPWMKKTNEYLEPLTPIEVLNRGHIDRLWHIIHNVGSGMPT